MEGTQVSSLDKNKPELKFRAGSIALTVWNNEVKNESGESNAYKTVTINRAYKTKGGEWKNTSSLRLNDVPKLIMLLTKLYNETAIKN